MLVKTFLFKGNFYYLFFFIFNFLSYNQQFTCPILKSLRGHACVINPDFKGFKYGNFQVKHYVMFPIFAQAKIVGTH